MRDTSPYIEAPIDSPPEEPRLLRFPDSVTHTAPVASDMCTRDSGGVRVWFRVEADTGRSIELTQRYIAGAWWTVMTRVVCSAVNVPE